VSVGVSRRSVRLLDTHYTDTRRRRFKEFSPASTVAPATPAAALAPPYPDPPSSGRAAPPAVPCPCRPAPAAASCSGRPDPPLPRWPAPAPAASS